MQKIKLLKVILSLVVTLAILFGAQSIWRTYAINLPLYNSLNAINEVESIAWHKNQKFSEPVVINITLSNNLDNFQRIYTKINEEILKVLGEKNYKIEIKDNRTVELENLYSDINCYIEQAILTGDFPLLSEKVKEKSQNIGASGKVYVDNQYVYIQLSKDSNSLYSLVSRH